MITTSFFNWYYKPNGVSIARSSPPWFRGEKYLALAPPVWLYTSLKEGKVSEAEFTKVYQELVLNKLDPVQVYKDLDGKCMLCHEPYGFCHRFLVSKWIFEELGKEVPEV